MWGCNTSAFWSRLNVIVVGIFALIIASCHENVQDQPEKEINDKDAIIDDLKSKYHIGSLMDTLNYEFSYQFDEIVDSDYQLIRRCFVQDIFIKNSDYYADVSFFCRKAEMYLELRFNEKTRKYLLNYLKHKENRIYSLYGAVAVVKLKGVKKIKLKIDSYHEFEYEEEDAYSYIDFGLPTGFIGYGELVDIRLADDHLMNDYP